MGDISCSVGIERIRFYPTTLSLDMSDLCAARGMDDKYVRSDLLIEARGLNPPWEDPVTMAVNAARPLLSNEDLEGIGLLIVATETGVDLEKPISSWVHRYLGLGPRCRNFEVKHACYGMTGALQLALAWLASGLAGDQKTLLINTDQSLIALGEPYEPVTGAGAIAMLLSNSPRLLSYELGRNGVYASEVYDVFRPTPQIETGDSETSLFSYLDALNESFADYLKYIPAGQDIDAHFDWYVYHMPFPGIASRAHRAVLDAAGEYSRAEAQQHFALKCLPSTTYSKRIGGCYGSSTFVGLMGLVESAPIQAGNRVAMFAYGSGSCAEFQSGILLSEAKATVSEAALESALDARRRSTFAEYEAIERERNSNIMAPDYKPNYDICGNWYSQRYEGKGALVLDKIERYYRHYRWS